MVGFGMDERDRFEAEIDTQPTCPVCGKVSDGFVLNAAFGPNARHSYATKIYNCGHKIDGATGKPAN